MTLAVLPLQSNLLEIVVSYVSVELQEVCTLRTHEFFKIAAENILRKNHKELTNRIELLRTLCLGLGVSLSPSPRYPLVFEGFYTRYLAMEVDYEKLYFKAVFALRQLPAEQVEAGKKQAGENLTALSAYNAAQGTTRFLDLTVDTLPVLKEPCSQKCCCAIQCLLFAPDGKMERIMLAHHTLQGIHEGTIFSYESYRLRAFHRHYAEQYKRVLRLHPGSFETAVQNALKG